MSDQGVSCLCLTYGRPHLLEEAVESFLRQSWDGPKELVIVNDHPRQTLIYDHPQVVIINLKRRLRTLGEKRNLSVALAKYDNLLVWDDDDIYMPWRIEETMKSLPAKHFFKCPNAWVMNDGRIEPNVGYNLYHGGTAYTRWLFEQSGGYSIMNGGEDADIENKFQKVGNGQYWPHTELPHERLYYIYRWSHGSYHTTGHTTLENIDPKVKAGDIQLEPKWHLPYQQLAFEAAGGGKDDVPARKSRSPINFIAFSKNRPLQLDGYLRSFQHAFEGQSELDLSVIYAHDSEYQHAYREVMGQYPWANFVRETDFYKNLISLFNDSEFTCFGCDDVVFTRRVDFIRVVERMRDTQAFAFSLRLGKHIEKSMFSGQMSQPEYEDDGHVMTWDLHKAHAHGDFGYSWELDGTIYPTDVAKQVVMDVRPVSPNILEANGGGKWSSKTTRSTMSCFHDACITVPTVNVVQSNFANPVVGKEISAKFLLDAWKCGMRLDIGRYRDIRNDCIHIPDLYLANK